jgi:hypothetical protein
VPATNQTKARKIGARELDGDAAFDDERTKSRRENYRRFATAAEAIRYVVETNTSWPQRPSRGATQRQVLGGPLRFPLSVSTYSAARVQLPPFR